MTSLRKRELGRRAGAGEWGLVAAGRRRDGWAGAWEGSSLLSSPGVTATRPGLLWEARSEPRGLEPGGRGHAI